MADYIYLDNYSKKGELGIHRHVFDQLVTSSLRRVKGIAKSEKLMKRTQFIILNRPVQTYIVRGIVHIWIYIDVAKGKNIQSVVSEIQKEVYNSLLLITEQIPVNVQVKVESII
jgi:uncharacterized alkaline shock family protein YloU